jgi:hypothetical protein
MFWKIFLELCSSINKKPTTVVTELNIGRGCVTSWKKGAMPQDTQLLKIAAYFNVTVAYLKGEEPDSDPIQLDDSRVGIMKKLNTLTPDQVKAAEQYIDFLASQTQNQ